MENLFKTEEKMAMTFIKRILREDKVLLKKVMLLNERKAFIRNVRTLIACVYASDSSVSGVKEFFERVLYCFEKARMGC